MQQQVKEIRALLTGVHYPGSSRDIVSLDMIQNISVDDREITVRLLFCEANDPFAAAIVKKCEALLKEKHGDRAIRVSVVTPGDRERPLSLEHVKHVVAISSGKGGVGKSTIASNLAVSLASLGYKTGLVDADIFGPSIPKMFGGEDAAPCMIDVDGKEWIEPPVRHGVKLLSIGFFVDPQSATVWRGPMASNALKQMIEEAYWGELDFLLIDLPPGTGDIHLTLVQTVALSGAIVVSTPQQIALADAVKGINMFESPGIQVPVLGLVENMSWFTPAELPDNKYYIFGKEGVKKLADEKGLRLLGQIPVVQAIMEGGESGTPVATDEHSITGQAFRDLALSLATALSENDATARRVRLK